MISFLTGVVCKRLPTGAILNVQGVGYAVELPLPVLCSLPAEGEACSLWIYTRVREDGIRLFGFSSLDDRQAFAVLLNINGVGPKVALAILSTLSIALLKTAVETRQTHFLESVPGIGRRTAEKILVELQNKLDKLPSHVVFSDHLRKGTGASRDQLSSAEKKDFHDLYSALENLGFKNKDIVPVLKQLAKEYNGDPFQDLIRKALTLIHNVNHLGQGGGLEGTA